MSDPKLFVSYSWSNSPHEQRVLELATELRQSGVDVILDKWDLKEGHDAVAFMERMVTDPEVAKVAIVCDETYATKADGREGGVGTETQIVSKEVYDKQAQDKFVAVVMERSPDGEPYLPTPMSSSTYYLHHTGLHEPPSNETQRLRSGTPLASRHAWARHWASTSAAAGSYCSNIRSRAIRSIRAASILPSGPSSEVTRRSAYPLSLYHLRLRSHASR